MNDLELRGTTRDAFPPVALADGESLGAVEVARPDWPPGSVIYRGGDAQNLRIVDVLAGDDPGAVRRARCRAV